MRIKFIENSFLSRVRLALEILFVKKERLVKVHITKNN